MSATSTAPPNCATAEAVLADAVRLRKVGDDTERHLLVRAVQWAEAHRAHPDGQVFFDDPEGTLPAIGWDAGVEFALAVGLSHQGGERMIQEGLELRYRLGLVWNRVLTGDIQAWRARRIAAVTLGLPGDVAAFIDEHVAAVAHKVGAVKLDRLLDEAMLCLYPEQREQQNLDALDARQVKLLKDVSANGVATIIINADLKDALDFNERVTEIAHLLKAAGCEEDLEVRRALAVGILADPARALALLESAPEPTARRKRMTLVVHISEDAIKSTGTGIGDDCRCGGTNSSTPGSFDGIGAGPVARLERGDAPVLASMIREWCGRGDTHLSVIPVIDTTDHIAVDRYEIPDRLADQVDQHTHTCCFPFCHRPARACDHDHNTPYAKGGTTCSCNLAPLCRRHHRLKTHTEWGYDTVERGAYLWHSPLGRSYYRDTDGTLDVTLPGDQHEHTGCIHPGDTKNTKSPDDTKDPKDCKNPKGPAVEAVAPWTPEEFRKRAKLLDEQLTIVKDRRGPFDHPMCHPDEFDPMTDLEPWDITDAEDPITAPHPGTPQKPTDNKPPF